MFSFGLEKARFKMVCLFILMFVTDISKRLIKDI